ncbi:hypothetical protein SFUMM280S_01356 [Streptomyces fumanus]
MDRLPPHVRRARRPEHKELRLASIVDAARSLALEKGVREVTLTDIAARAGINKSAVLRYVETREEIYLRLTAECWTRWAAALAGALGGRTDGTPDELAATLARRRSRSTPCSATSWPTPRSTWNGMSRPTRS